MYLIVKRHSPTRRRHAANVPRLSRLPLGSPDAPPPVSFALISDEQGPTRAGACRGSMASDRLSGCDRASRASRSMLRRTTAHLCTELHY